MEIVLRYFDGCPNLQTADARLREALAATGHGDQPVSYEKVETPEDAERLGFVGSPTLLINGRDPFATSGAPTGLACRVFATPDGLAGSPTVEQWTAILLWARRAREQNDVVRGDHGLSARGRIVVQTGRDVVIRHGLQLGRISGPILRRIDEFMP